MSRFPEHVTEPVAGVDAGGFPDGTHRYFCRCGWVSAEWQGDIDLVPAVTCQREERPVLAPFQPTAPVPCVQL